MIFSLFRRRKGTTVIDRLHGEIMAAARDPRCYRDCGVPDTFEGRFELLALMATPPVARLAALPAPGPEMAQDLTDAIFTGLDDALRQMGTADTGVPKRMNKMASGWLGRRQAYAEALTSADMAALAAAIARNVFGGAPPAEGAPERIAAFVRATADMHAKFGVSDYMSGVRAFPDAAAFIEPTL